MERALRISTVGLRGIVGSGLTAAHVLDFASAFATYLDTPGPVVIGRDPRASGVMLREGVTASLMSCGRDVLDLGIVPTPVIQHAINLHDAAGGISIGASHNSADWNALKFFGPRGTYLSTAQAGELLDIYHLKRFCSVGWQQMGKVTSTGGALDSYLDELADAFDFEPLRRYRVVVDCCNGTSALVLRRMNERFGFSFILINERLEPVAFAHEPSTTRDAVAMQLAPLMKPLQADAGFLFDVDSDRVALADEQGTPLSEELVMPLLAEHLLPHSEGKLIITNLSTTALIESIAARHGGRVLRVPVGRQAAIDALSAYRPEQIALAGEGTGAVMMPRFRFVYDGIASMLGILSLMAQRNSRLSELVAAFPRYSILKGTVPLRTQRIPALLMHLRERYEEEGGTANIADGLRMSWPDRWFHVRVSQTEPMVRVICEQQGSPPTALYESLLDEVRRSA